MTKPCWCRSTLWGSCYGCTVCCEGLFNCGCCKGVAAGCTACGVCCLILLSPVLGIVIVMLALLALLILISTGCFGCFCCGAAFKKKFWAAWARCCAWHCCCCWIKNPFRSIHCCGCCCCQCADHEISELEKQNKKKKNKKSNEEVNQDDWFENLKKNNNTSVSSESVKWDKNGKVINIENEMNLPPEIKKVFADLQDIV